MVGQGLAPAEKGCTKDNFVHPAFLYAYILYLQSLVNSIYSGYFLMYTKCLIKGGKFVYFAHLHIDLKVVKW